LHYFAVQTISKDCQLKTKSYKCSANFEKRCLIENLIFELLENIAWSAYALYIYWWLFR